MPYIKSVFLIALNVLNLEEGCPSFVPHVLFNNSYGHK
jgi:hypothetical protein